MKFNRFAPFALVIATDTLAACTSETDQAAAPATGEIPLEVTNARLMLPAVSGRPGAIYFDVENTGKKNFAIRRADVAGAGSAELHGTMEMNGEMMMDGLGQVLVNSGSTESFEPGGNHVMVFEVDPALEPGGTTDMTLTVVGGKTRTYPVEIRAAGDER